MSEKAEPKNQNQSEGFKRLARELECDEDEARWKDKLRRIAGQKDQPKKEKPAK